MRRFLSVGENDGVFSMVLDFCVVLWVAKKSACGADFLVPRPRGGFVIRAGVHCDPAFVVLGAPDG